MSYHERLPARRVERSRPRQSMGNELRASIMTTLRVRPSRIAVPTSSPLPRSRKPDRAVQGWTSDLAAPVSARYFPISISVCRRLVRYVTETGLWSRISRVRPTSAARLVAARSSRSIFALWTRMLGREDETGDRGAEPKYTAETPFDVSTERGWATFAGKSIDQRRGEQAVRVAFAFFTLPIKATSRYYAGLPWSAPKPG
jgi:hypothetical protein